MPVLRKNDSRSDSELVDACNNGAAADATRAFTELYRRHKDFVVRVALRLSGDHDLALDALQDTFSYLLRQFPPTGKGLSLTAKLTTYLYPVARNTTITLLRKRQRHNPIGAIDPDSLPADDDVMATDFSGLLATLNADQREVVVLRFIEDMPLADIAAALDIPLGTVKSRLHKAIGELRKSPETSKFFDK